MVDEGILPRKCYCNNDKCGHTKQKKECKNKPVVWCQIQMLGAVCQECYSNFLPYERGSGA